MPDHGGSHDADGPGAGDENIFAEDIEGQRGVDGVAERVKDARHVAIHALAMMPDVCHRQGDVFGKCAGPIDADPLCVSAKVPPSGQTVATTPADDVPSPETTSPGKKSVTFAPTSTISADELVPDNHRHRNGALSPSVPLIDMEISAANAGAVDPDEDIIDAATRFGDVL
jgi:hypothetical protein